uniref:Gingipain domain-containing protein n=1 Tax=candidate division WOR-3 bacterium TaxID=2052148 RepID=A0A7V3ZUX6_UNCW3
MLNFGIKNVKMLLMKKISRYLLFFLFSFLSYGKDFIKEGYLIIVPDEFYNEILPLVNWKRELGYYVFLKKKSEVGNTNIAIKNFIKSFYDTTSIPLKFLLLCGAINKIPAFTIQGTSLVTDNTYGCMDNDYLPEIYVGRLPASTVQELSIMVSKIIYYEKGLQRDTNYYKRGLAVATTYVGGAGTRAISALETKRWWRQLLLNNSFLEVDTIFYDLPPYPTTDSIKNAIERGVLYINGRGWGNYEGWHYPRFYREDVYNLQNTNKLPVIFSFYCGTGNFNANPCFGEVFLRVGQPNNLAGAVLFFGPSYAGTSTRFNNCLDAAIFKNIFDNSPEEKRAGEVILKGKILFLNSFPNLKDSQEKRIHFETYNILGDPSLRLWTKLPKNLNVSLNINALRIGNNYLALNIKDENNQPIKDGKVIILIDSLPLVKKSDENGNVYFPLNLSEEGRVKITVNVRDYYLYQCSLPVLRNERNLSYFSHRALNNYFNTSCSLYLSVKNYGNFEEEDVSVTIYSLSENLVIEDSIKNYGQILVSEVKEGGPFILRILRPSEESSLILVRINSSSGNYYSLFAFNSNTPNFSYSAFRYFDGNNNIIEPNEEGNLYIKIKNIGNFLANNILGILSSKTNGCLMLDSISSYGHFSLFEEKENLTPFRIRVLNDVQRNRRLVFHLYLYENNSFLCSLKFDLYTGIIDSTACSFSNSYRYYAYEDIDYSYNERPAFNWQEIDPNFGGRGIKINLRNDDCKVINLPPNFNFRFCGEPINKITVSDNGVLILDSVRFIDFYNWSIYHPFVYQKSLLIFWDDFHPDTLNASGVYYYYDTLNNTFIVEWSRVKHIHGFISPQIGEDQTFQIILFDSHRYPTKTGDGVIIFQYLNVFDDDTFHNYSTVGIREKDYYSYSSGLQVKFGADYEITFGNIRNNKIIKFTPNPPDTYTVIKEKEKVSLVLKKHKIFDLIKNEKDVEIYDITGKRCDLKKIKNGIYFVIIRKDILLKKKIVLIK